jgi:hypothetical protein
MLMAGTPAEPWQMSEMKNAALGRAVVMAERDGLEPYIGSIM